MKRTLTLYFSMLIITGIAITFVMFAFIEKWAYEVNNPTAVAYKDFAVNPVIPKTAINTAFSYDNQYFTYLLNNKIYINSLQTGKNVDLIGEKSPISYYKLLLDKNVILYITKSIVSNKTVLTVKTYNIISKKTTEFNKISTYNFNKVKDVEFSSVTNVIYINVESKMAAKLSNTIYRIDIMLRLSTFASGKIMDDMTLLHNRDKLYYVDTNNNLYYANSRSNIFKVDKVTILGHDADDNIYAQSNLDKKRIYKIQDNKIVDNITLDDTGFTSIYNNQNTVYLIYPNKVIDLSSSSPNDTITNIKDGFKFEAIIDNIIYYINSKNQLVKEKI